VLEPTTEQEEAKERLWSVLLSNQAMGYLKLGLYTEAHDACIDAIRHDDRNGKAYYRLAQALIGLKEFEECERKISDALGKLSDDAELCASLQGLLKTARKERRMYQDRQKVVFGNMFR
jgi:tetratricopeptide (TPR) repeat protein